MKRFVGPMIVIALVGGAGLWFYLAMQYEYGPYGPVRRAACRANLIQIAKASLLYAQDFDDRIFPSERWMDVLSSPYRTRQNVRKEALRPVKEDFRCLCLAATSKGGPNAFGYAFNSKLSMAGVKSFELPEHTPLAYESNDTHWNAYDPVTSFSGPYDTDLLETGRANMVFLDGHVERMLKK